VGSRLVSLGREGLSGLFGELAPESA